DENFRKNLQDVPVIKSGKADYEYERCWIANIFMANEPLRGKRYIKVTERKTKTDWAYLISESTPEGG
ncbi:MAG: hypothetical protein LBD27_05385, partial [Tannerella sp.]|nr:hypothetical protein [Tannerella sp.]